MTVYSHEYEHLKIEPPQTSNISLNRSNIVIKTAEDRIYSYEERSGFFGRYEKHRIRLNGNLNAFNEQLASTRPGVHAVCLIFFEGHSTHKYAITDAIIRFAYCHQENKFMPSELSPNFSSAIQFSINTEPYRLFVDAVSSFEIINWDKINKKLSLRGAGTYQVLPAKMKPEDNKLDFFVHVCYD